MNTSNRLFLLCFPAVLTCLALLPSCGSSAAKWDIPTAKITGSKTAGVRSLVLLSGAESKDKRNFPISYQWSLVDQPIGSSAVLTGLTGSTTSFFADKGGSYNVQLVVTNSNGLASAPDSFVVDVVGSGSNHPPVAVIKVIPGTIFAYLDGTQSYDLDNNPLTFLWSTGDMAGCEVAGPIQAMAELWFVRSGVTCVVSLTVYDGLDWDTSFVQAAGL